MVRPGALINIDYAGNISTFCPELLMGYSDNIHKDKFSFGNVEMDDFEDIVDKDNFKSVSQGIMVGREKCKKTCDYFDVCGGGAPSNRYAEHGSFEQAETLFCRYQIKSVADAVLDFMEEDIQS